MTATAVMQDEFDSRRISDRLEEKLTRTGIHRRRQGLHRERDLLLHRDRGRAGPAGLLVQGRGAGLRAGDRAVGARLSGLRRQRDVQEPRQSAGQSECRPAVHRDARQAEAAAGQRDGARQPRRSAACGRRSARNSSCGSPRARSSRIVRAISPRCRSSNPPSTRRVPGCDAGGAGLEGVRRLQGRDVHPRQKVSRGPADASPTGGRTIRLKFDIDKIRTIRKTRPQSLCGIPMHVNMRGAGGHACVSDFPLRPSA